jgi:lipoprotein NlpI
MTWTKFLPWKNSWFQLSIVTAVCSAGLLMANLRMGPSKTLPNPFTAIMALIHVQPKPSPDALAQAQQVYSSGETALNSGDYTTSIQDYTQAINLNPKYTDALLERARAYDDKGDHNDAIQDDTALLQIDPSYKMAYNNRGYAYYEINNYPLAIADYNKAIELDPNFAMAFTNRGYAYIDSGNDTQALKDFTLAFQLDPTSSDAWEQAAWILATSPIDSLRDGRKALVYANKAGELSQWKANGAYEVLAAADAETGDYDGAIKAVNQYINTGLTGSDLTYAQQQLAQYRSGNPFHRSSQ